MRLLAKSCCRIPCLLSLLLLLISGVAYADPGNQYCITPPFVTSGIKPNLLLMIDNSASMFDLAYSDKGKKHCTANTGTSCQYDSDCPTGDTCGVFDRRPYYCYDETYSNSNDYTGYFEPDTYYSYRSGTDDFVEEADFANACPAAAGETVKSIAGTMCVRYVTASGTLSKFAAKGNYLNWLTASKLDVQKQILTGGKWDGAGLISESRGCVGQGYVKNALTTDFVNFSGASTNDDNVSLGVTFTVTGPANANNPSAPSAGGSTYLNLFAGSVYNYADCQKAVDSLATGTNAAIKQNVAACLTSSAPSTGYCQQAAGTSCTTSSQCVVSSSSASFVCSGSPLMSCTGTSDATSCSVAARSACSLDSTRACTTDSNCEVAVAEKMGTCGSYTPALPNGAKPPISCRAAIDCDYSKSGRNYTGTCSGYVAPSSTDYGDCVSTLAKNFGPCVSNYTGPCVLPGSAAGTVTKVSFQQSMQACWQLRNGHAIGNDEINTVKNHCSDIYGSYATCSNNRLQTCSSDANCSSGGTCQGGPAAIGPGNPALMCGVSYEGQFYEKNSSGAWVLKSTATTQQMIDVHTQFCGDLATPSVTDPTDAPSDTTVTDNLPAIISSVGVEAQMGKPVGRMRVRLATATEPTGLVQQFGVQIRLGAMSFNPFGSASETALSGVGVPKTCSNGTPCTKDVDCGGASGSCATATNRDGAKILYPIGKGLCATMVGASCETDANCSGGNSCLNGYCGTKGTTICTTVKNCSGANQACIADGVGSRTGSGTLAKAIDDIKADSWTPLSEAFYNAIGYFAQIPTGSDAGKSRTALRLNSVNVTSTNFSDATAAPVDFNENLNPSEYRCQQNYTLLISDGSSTADRNSAVSGLATLYATPAGVTQVACSGAGTGSTADYGGNNNLPVLTWLAKNRRIYDFNLTGTPSTTVPASARDTITSYVVFNGEGNGAAGDCNSLTLLTKAASKGGTTIKQAEDPDELRNALTAVFQEVAAKAASGTAASILSNSEGSGANILQAVFYPKKIFENQTEVKWVGEMQNLWYFVDPLINNSTIREDTVTDKKLNLVSDYVARFAFDNSSDKTMVQLYRDSDGDGTGDIQVGGLIDPDNVKSIWRAGKLLWSRNISTNPRNLKTSLDGSSMIDFSSATFPGGSVASNSNALAPYLNVAAADAPKLIDFVHGKDDATLRNRTVSIKDPVSSVVSSGVWRLGDIISSTPRVQSTVRLGTYNLAAPGGYNDNSYLSYINSNQYKSRGMVYVGANDGMLHAFKLGLLSVKATGNEKASITGDPAQLGQEQWAYIPRSFLPYLRYTADPGYQHLYAVDGKTVLLDASIGDTNNGTCVKGSYWLCGKSTSLSVVNGSNNLNAAVNTWRSVVIGGMGLGGATAKTSGTDDVVTPRSNPANEEEGLGYSSYFALDVTDPDTPELLWEFNDPALGYATTGPAIVRVGSANTNGRWFAVFGSGPTGSIDTDTHQFKGRSNQTLKFFVVDLRNGNLVQTIDTGIENAFAGSMIGGSIDTDRWNSGVAGNYQDEAIYVGYTNKVTSGAAAGTWTDGGVIRIMTKESIAPATTPWIWSKVIEGIGPVTSSVARLQDKKNRNLWLFSGTGRYFFRDGAALDDYNGSRMLFGIKDPCYNKGNIGNYLDKNCSDTISGTPVNQTSTLSAINEVGWQINLDASTPVYGAERMVTDPVALTNGTVFFTSFKPTMDLCGYGGDSYLWGVKYDTGGAAPANALKGKALIQLSTGEFKEVDLATAFTDVDRLNRRMSSPMTGKPPSDAPPIVSNSSNRPVKKILHIREH